MHFLKNKKRLDGIYKFEPMFYRLMIISDNLQKGTFSKLYERPQPHVFIDVIRGGFRGADAPPPLRDSTLCRPKESPFGALGKPFLTYRP